MLATKPSSNSQVCLVCNDQTINDVEVKTSTLYTKYVQITYLAA